MAFPNSMREHRLETQLACARFEAKTRAGVGLPIAGEIRAIERIQHEIWLRDGALAFSGMDLERLLRAAQRDANLLFDMTSSLSEAEARMPRQAAMVAQYYAAGREVERLQAAIYVRDTTPRRARPGAASGDRRLKVLKNESTSGAVTDGLRAQRSAPADAGVSRREWVERKETTEPTLQGTYVERTYSGYLWRCNGCGLVWEKQHLATGCADRKHVVRFEDRYGGYVENGVWKGGRSYERRAVRRERTNGAAPKNGTATAAG